MFSLRDFIKKGFLKAVGKKADFQIILESAAYYEKGILTEEDLKEIEFAIESKPAKIEVPEGSNN